MLKREALSKYGYNQDVGSAVVPVKNDDAKSQVSRASSRGSQLEPLFQKPKALEYLNKGREQKESVKDFLNFSRQILMS